MKVKDQYAFIHGCYTTSKANDIDDAVIVKRYKISPDGKRTPEVRIHNNIKRDYWITKPIHRNHEGKLEYEYLNRVDKFSSTQRALGANILKKLGMIPQRNPNLRNICNSPYVYGVDLDITCIVGDMYKKHFPDVEPFDLVVGCMDTETNVVDGSNDIIIKSFYSDGGEEQRKAVVTVHRDWLLDRRHTEESIRDFVISVVPEVVELGIDLEIKLCDTPSECIIHAVNRAHEWKPDIIGYWNINFDMPIVEKTLRDEGHDPADIFSDPIVPPELRYYRYHEGQTTKLTDSGKFMPLAPSQQWHTVYTPASFYFIDPSSTYRCLRRQKSEPSYSLDYITTKIVGKGKLKPADLDHMENVMEGTLKWHYVMQKYHQLWYIAYALVDVIQPVRMDSKTGDLAKKLPILAMGSHWKDFNSNPRRLCDQLHNFFLSKNAVVGTTGAEMESPLDKNIPASKGWIVTLEAPIIEDFGIRLLDPNGFHKAAKDKGFRRSKLFFHNADLDIVATYPILGMLFNIARETALFETCKIEGLDYFSYRETCVNITAGVANSLLLGEEVLGLKGLEDLLEVFEREHSLPSTNQRLEDEFIESERIKTLKIKEANRRTKEAFAKKREKELESA